jgi:large subunit ribosomal protein L25
VEVPITVTGQAAPDTIVELQLTSLPVLTEATHIPTGFEVSVDRLEAGSQVTAGQVPIPAGTELAIEPETVVVHVGGAPSAAQLEADLEQPEAPEGEAAAEAPAAEAEAPAEA